VEWPAENSGQILKGQHHTRKVTAVSLLLDFDFVHAGGAMAISDISFATIDGATVFAENRASNVSKSRLAHREPANITLEARRRQRSSVFLCTDLAFRCSQNAVCSKLSSGTSGAANELRSPFTVGDSQMFIAIYAQVLYTCSRATSLCEENQTLPGTLRSGREVNVAHFANTNENGTNTPCLGDIGLQMCFRVLQCALEGHQRDAHDSISRSPL